MTVASLLIQSGRPSESMKVDHGSSDGAARRLLLLPSCDVDAKAMVVAGQG
jgi:hypothetical protein